MKYYKLTERLGEFAKYCKKKGYEETELKSLFFAQVLLSLDDLLTRFKGIENQMKYLWQSLDELKEKKKVEDET